MTSAALLREQVLRVLDGMSLRYAVTDGLAGFGYGWTVTLGIGRAEIVLWGAEHDVGESEPTSLLVLNARVAEDVPSTANLDAWIATESGRYLVGNLYVDPRAGQAGVYLRHTLLADRLADADLVVSLRLVGVTADQLATEVVDRFGGKPAAD
jgi:hypothetical protein